MPFQNLGLGLKTAQGQLQYYKFKNKNLCLLVWLRAFQNQNKELEAHLETICEMVEGTESREGAT